MLTLFWVFDIERKHVHILMGLALPLLLFIYLENCNCILGINSIFHFHLCLFVTPLPQAGFGKICVNYTHVHACRALRKVSVVIVQL